MIEFHVVWRKIVDFSLVANLNLVPFWTYPLIGRIKTSLWLDKSHLYLKRILLFFIFRYEIMNGFHKINCPSSKCLSRGSFFLEEIKGFVKEDIFKKHLEFRQNFEISQDPNQAWCPKPNCNTVCLKYSSFFCCPKCNGEFCPDCMYVWHPSETCQEYGKKKLKKNFTNTLKI